MLKENELKSLVVENISDGIYTLDRKGRFTYVNDVIVRRSGYPREWFLSRSYLDVIRDEDKKSVKDNFEAVMKGRYVEPYEVAYYRADGSIMWVEINTTGIYDRNKKIIGLIGISRDITARKNSEDELKRYQRELKDLVEKRTEELRKINEELQYRLRLEDIVSTISASFINLPMEKVDDEINYALKKIGEFLGADSSYIFIFSEYGTRMDITHEWCADGIEPYIDKLKGLRTDKYPYFMEKIKNLQVMYLDDIDNLPAYAKNERKLLKTQNIKSMIDIPMIYQGRAIGFIGIESEREKKTYNEDVIFVLMGVARTVTNVLLRREARADLEKSEAKYRAIFDTAHDAIFLIENYRFIECNDYTLKLFDCTREEIIGREPSDFSPDFQPDGGLSREKVRQLMYRALSGEPLSFEWRHRTAKGDILETEVSLGSLNFGKKTMLIAIVRDITERKKAEETLKINTKTLEEYNTALKVLLKQREDDKKELEENILSNIRELVMPYIEKLKEKNEGYVSSVYLDMLEANLKNIVSPFSKRLSASMIHFTPTEIKVANMIKEGKSVKEIATILGVSINSVNLHRQNIRNKFGLNKKKVNLKTYLMSFA